MVKGLVSKKNIDFEENTNSQTFPDFLLDKDDHKKGLLEVKSFDFDRGPGFDLANFDSYCNSLLENAYRIDSNYLILAYQMNDGVISINRCLAKKDMGISLSEWNVSPKSSRKEKRNL
jgi:type II restriction enzyme